MRLAGKKKQNRTASVVKPSIRAVNQNIFNLTRKITMPTTHALPLTPVARRLGYAALSKKVFTGRVLKFSAGGAPLIRATRRLCREVFATANPQKAHEHYKRDAFLLRAAEAQKQFNTDSYRALFAQWLSAIGIDYAPLYWDTLGLRIAPPEATHSGGFRSATPVHRDTWGAGLQTQINWWAPIWPLTQRRTMGFYPDYWNRPLKNTTPDWSFREYLAHRKQSAQSGKRADYPSVPYALEEPQTPIYPLLIDVGEVVAFSSAHLHRTISNTTALTRFSFEVRTLDPAQKNNGAINVDCDSREPLYRLFRSTTDNSVALPPFP